MAGTEGKKLISSEEGDRLPLDSDELNQLESLSARAEKQGLKPFKSFTPDSGGKRFDTKLTDEQVLASTPEGFVDERILKPESISQGKALAGVLNALKEEGLEAKALRTDSGDVGPWVDEFLNSVGDLSQDKKDKTIQ